MDSSLSDSCTSSTDRSLPTVFQVDEMTSSLGNFTLAGLPSRDEVGIENTVEYDNVKKNESTGNSVNVEVNSHAGGTLETENHLPAETHDMSLPTVFQVDEVTSSLRNFTLADLPSRDEVGIENTVEYDNVKKNESTGNSVNVEVNSHVEKTLTTEKHLPAETHDDKTFLREQLNRLECPFTWKIQNQSTHDTPEAIIARTIEKIEEIEEGSTFQWRRFILTLIACYEHFHKGEVTASWDKQRICEEIFNPSDAKGTYESFFQATKDALSHVIFSCKCHLYFETGVLSEARQTLKKVCKYEEMDNPCKAAIWGIRAAVSMEYGYEGTKVAVEYIKKALELDPQQGEWHFLYGKSLGRLRRIDSFNVIPAHEELKALEKAVEITKSPSYIIFLAQAYREAAFRVYSLHKNDLASLKARLEEMNERSSQLYREALNLRSDCSHINIRCAQGFSKLPTPYKDLKLAKECCDKALALAPNNAMAHHVAGSIYDWYERDLERAKKHYQMAGDQGSYGAYMDLYKLKFSEDSTYDPIPDFEFLLKRFTEKPRMEETLCQMGSFYLFIRNDLATAYKDYWSKVISQNPNSEKLKTHKCAFLHMRTPVSIYELIVDEARLRLDITNGAFASEEDRKLFRQIIIKCSRLFSELLQNSPKPRRKMALDEAANAGSHRSRSLRGRGRGRGGSRGWGRGRGRGRGRGMGMSRGDSHERGNGSQSRERTGSGSLRGNFRGRYNRGTSRDSSTESRSSNRGGYRYRVGSRDSSTESRSSNRDGYRYRVGSRDSSTDSRDGQHSKERHFGSSWHQRRDSSNESRSTLDKNWRSGPRDFNQIVEVKLSHHRDSSSSSSVGGRSDHVQKYDGYRRPRTDSLSSIGSASGVPNSSGGRVRTESNSSVGSDTRRDWKEGCLGGGPKSRKSQDDKNWQVCEGSKFKFGPEERQIHGNLGYWREGRDGRRGFQRSEPGRQNFQRDASYGRERSQGNISQNSGSTSLSIHHNRKEGGAVEASSSEAYPSGWQGNKNATYRRGGYKAKEVSHLKLSWRNSKNE